jgi:hypothetical protein
MCFITWEKAYCLFPDITFVKHEAYTTLRIYNLPGGPALLRAWRMANLKSVPVPLQEHRKSLKILAERNALSRSVWGNTSETSIYAHERYVGDSQS